MSKYDIQQAIQQLSRSPGSFSVLGTVEAINLDELTCDVAQLLEQPDIYRVKLMPKDINGQAKKGLLQIPKIGSVVVVSWLNSTDDAFISMFSEVDFIHLNGKNFGGLIMIEELIKKINNLENKVNTIIGTFNTHTHTSACTAGGATTAVPSGTVTGTLTPTKKIELENTTVLHGDGN